MYLSFTGYSTAESCDFNYWHVYLGKTPHAKEDDRLGSIYGTVVGKLFDRFYVERLWKLPDTKGTMLAMVPAVVDQTLKEEQEPRKGRPGGVIRWKGLENPQGLYLNREEVIADVELAIPRGLQTIKEHRFLGKDVRSEWKLDTDVEGHRLAGRPDFTMTRIVFKDYVILDGKGSRHRSRYLDPTQLLWYSMLLREHTGRFPDWSGYLHWRYEPPYNVDRLEFTQSDADDLKHKVLKKIQGIERSIKTLQKERDPGLRLDVVREVFKPNADPKNCRFCPYAAQDVCPEGYSVRQKLDSQYNR